ncbi:hypothetical protein RDE2_19880 [Rhodococcus sp. RDE2]|nr:hypothetical protein RDE2_19880 [Rhodococcus sp. RDE2]
MVRTRGRSSAEPVVEHAVRAAAQAVAAKTAIMRPAREDTDRVLWALDEKFGTPKLCIRRAVNVMWGTPGAIRACPTRS